MPCAEIGRVTGDGMMRVLNNGRGSEIPAKPLRRSAALFARSEESDCGLRAERMKICSRKYHASSAKSAVHSLRLLLRDPSIASKNWVYRQYAHGPHRHYR